MNSILLCAVFVSTLLGQRNVAGIFANESNVPLRNIKVRVHPKQLTLGEPPSFLRAETSETGAFTLANLPKGVFHLCPEIPDRSYVDPCIWDESPPRIDTTDNKPIHLPVIKLRRTATVIITLEDPLRLWNSPRTAGRSHILVGVTTPLGVMQPASQSNVIGPSGSPAKAFLLALPANSTHTLHVASFLFQILDYQNRDVARSPILITAGPPGTTIRITLRIASVIDPR